MYTWNLPTKVLFGPGKIKQLQNEPLPGQKALIVISNGKSVKMNGALSSVQDGLRSAGIDYAIFDKIQANPLEGTIMDGVIAARENHCDFIIGLGGGSVLDSATMIAAISPQKEGRLWDYIIGGTGGGKMLIEDPLPCVEITTSAGTGSEVDRWGVVTNPATHEKVGFQGAFPVLAIVDPELMVSVPADFTAYQGFDALFHSTEGYISNTHNEAGDMVELAAIRDISEYLPTAVRNGEDLEARTKMAFANTMSGYSMELGSCTSEHSMEHALSGYHSSLPHGAGLIMISIAYYSYFINIHACDDRFVDMARAMGIHHAKDPMDFITALKKLQNDCGVGDLKMSDYGIKPEEFPAMARTAMDSMGGLFLCDPTALSEEDVIKIYKASYK